ncbi:MAG: M20/M25/M40 family metallo-hydrolase [Solirubrobacteraceae bacterium]|jgi:acetylornithine deacetylase/succinyl-diaminopimelate desuccinylase-like protein
MSVAGGSVALQDRPVELLQRLLRFDTSNPPGNEGECIRWVQGLLEDLGCEVRILAREPARPNLVARLPGRGDCGPLLLQGHVDVVAARGEWCHQPFAGELDGGYVWGRGALDMKGGVAMMLAAFMRAKASGMQPPGDVILCLLADEEAGSDYGANYLVSEHPELFKDVRYAIGEFGGFTMHLAGRRFYPVMVAEKQVCWSRATIRGRAGHGSLPLRGGAMAKLGRLLSRLDRQRLPVHVTPVARSMVESIAQELPTPLALPLRWLLVPSVTDHLLDVLGERGKTFDPILHNTASATIVGGGEKINVIPDQVSVDLDCRLLPGFGPAELFAELRAHAGIEMELEVVRHDPGAAEPDLGLFATLAETLRELDPAAKPVPLLLPAMTDGRFFARLGIQTYGFLPMKLAQDLPFMDLIHAENERLPAEAMEFGSNAIGRVLERFA